MKKLLLIGTMLTFFIASNAYAKHINLESFYQDIWCERHNGITEVIMLDGTRCDCLTDDEAIEVDFAGKFYEGIGQALHYAMLTGRKRGGLLLIVENPHDLKFVDRAIKIIEHYKLPITLYVIEPAKEK